MKKKETKTLISVVEVQAVGAFLSEYAEYVTSLKIIPEGEEVLNSHCRDVADIADLNQEALYDVYDVDNGHGTVELTLEDTTPVRYQFSKTNGKLIKGFFNKNAMIGRRMNREGFWQPVFLRVPNVLESNHELGGQIRLFTYASAVRFCEGDLQKVRNNFHTLASAVLADLRKEKIERDRLERDKWKAELR